jgi:transposase
MRTLYKAKHHRVDHGRNEFVKHKAHINGIENFWGLAKRFASCGYSFI